MTGKIIAHDIFILAKIKEQKWRKNKQTNKKHFPISPSDF